MTVETHASHLNPLLKRPARPMPRRVAVVGAGTIGPDIAYYLMSSIPDLTLSLVDIAPEALDRAAKRLEGYVGKGLAKGKLTEEQARRVRENVAPTLDYGDIADCDWVLEAATENLELKHRIFAQIEEIVSPQALITSNTSSLPASRVFADLTHKGRATVTHFFAPAFRNPVVEVVRWADGDPGTVEYLSWLFAATGKVPLITSDVICFMLDRIFDNWCNEAAYLLDEATAAEVDSTAMEFVHAGPFFVLNLARGNPIIVETNTLQMEEGEHYRPAPVLRSVETWATVGPGERTAVKPEKAARIRDRLLGILFAQSLDVLDRSIGSPSDLDLGCRLALGFKQGPLDLMRRLGDADVTRILDRLVDERPGMPRPERPIESDQGFRHHVLVDDLDGVKVITLRRPDALNALNDEVTDEVLAVVREHEADPAVAGFVIVGYGPRAFSAGADIGRFPEVLGDAKAAARYARDCSRLLVHFDAVRKPVVAALNGMALGGGLELAIRCHAIVAQRGAWLQFPEVTLGIAPGIGGLAVPYRRWPQAAETFHDMLRTGRRLSTVDAYELGMVAGLAGSYEELIELAVQQIRSVQKVSTPTPDGPVDIAAPAEIAPVAANGLRLSGQTVGVITEAIQRCAEAATLADALEIGYQAFAATACTDAAREGVTAFLERRPPDFTKTG